VPGQAAVGGDPAGRKFGVGALLSVQPNEIDVEPRSLVAIWSVPVIRYEARIVRPAGRFPPGR
jgi:hypothetical protein